MCDSCFFFLGVPNDHLEDDSDVSDVGYNNRDDHMSDDNVDGDDDDDETIANYDDNAMALWNSIMMAMMTSIVLL